MPRRLILTPAVFLTAAVFFVFYTITSAGALFQPKATQAIGGVTDTNVRDSSFVVSWVSDTATDGHVDWDTSNPPAGTKTSDPVASSTSHFVQITALSPSTTYLFQVRSGGETDDNGGSFYTVTTGPSIPPPVPGRTIFGTVFQSDGSTPAPNAIVYIRVQDDDGGGSPGVSQWGSARTDGSGLWFFELNNLRTGAFDAGFSFSNGTDDLALAWQGGSFGTSGSIANPVVFSVPTVYPAMFDRTLSPLVTATPTSTNTPTATNTTVPPTDTATATSTPTATNTPVSPTETATATATSAVPTATPTATGSPVPATNTPTATMTPSPTEPAIDILIYLPLVVR
jgi:hypothetical protein